MGGRKLILIGIIILIIVLFVLSKHPLSGRATLSWNADAEADVAGYKVYYGTNPRTGGCPPGGYTEKVDVKKTDTPQKPTYILKNLAIGKTYYFSVTTYDKSRKESCFSSEIKKRIFSPSLSFQNF